MFGIAALVFAFATLTAGSITPQIETTGCFRTKCLLNNCRNISCPNGIVVDNVNCPCCYRCAKQQGELCNVNTENNHTDYHYCDVGMQCKGAIPDPTSGQLLGTCVGSRSQQCVHGLMHKKGCLTCLCINGSERCWDNRTGIICPPIDCPFSQRYRPVDKCCILCRERPGDSEDCLEEISLLGDSVIIYVTRREPVSVVFHGDCMGLVNKPSQLSLFRNGKQLKNPMISIRTLRLPHSSGIQKIRTVIEITFQITSARKKDAGKYSLQYGIASANFTIIVQDLRLLDCTFEDGLCNWKSKTVPDHSSIGWWRHSGPVTPGIGPQAGHGGSDFYVYVQPSLKTQGHKALLKSVRATPPPKTVTFAYYMQGSSVGNLTVVQNLYGGNGNKRIEKWFRDGDQEGGWNTATVSIELINGYESSRITFLAHVGLRGYIALDSIMFT